MLDALTNTSGLSLSTLKQYTLEAVFQHVAQHMLKQSMPAIKANGVGCAYRGQDGMMCAVGFIIADDEYKPTLEGNGITSDLFDKYFDPLPEDTSVYDRHDEVMRDPYRKLLYELQSIHDDGEYRADHAGDENSNPKEAVREFWLEHLTFLANKYGYDTSKLV